MSESSRIAAQLHHAYHGPAWHGPALTAVLAGVTPELAARRPVPAAHTIWEIVLHITVWISVVTRRLHGEEITVLPPHLDWPAPPEASPDAWRQTLDRLAQAEQTLEDDVRGLPDDRLREKVMGDVPYSIYVMLHGVVQHSLYHAGQIALLKIGVR